MKKLKKKLCMIRPSFIKELQELPMTLKDWIIEIFCYNPISRFLKKIWRFILRLFRWLPLLWNQEEWDYEYVYDLIEMKMKELRKEMSKDFWHDQKVVQKSIKQINICLAHLDRWRNWTNYYYYPMDDVYHESTENGCYQMKYSSEVKEKQRLGAHDFEQNHYNKFWRDFLKWHQGWWT